MLSERERVLILIFMFISFSTVPIGLWRNHALAMGIEVRGCSCLCKDSARREKNAELCLSVFPSRSLSYAKIATIFGTAKSSVAFHCECHTMGR